LERSTKQKTANGGWQLATLATGNPLKFSQKSRASSSSTHFTNKTMYANKNYISLSFRADDEDTRDTDMNVDMNFENADDAKLARMLKTWLAAIEADITVTVK
jgi:hypothetical protein